jgi:hypothetical protein
MGRERKPREGASKHDWMPLRTTGRALAGDRGISHHMGGHLAHHARMLICWPVVLAADIFYLSFSIARGSFPMRCCRFSLWPSRSTAGGTGGAACAKRARCAWFRCLRGWLAGLVAGAVGAVLLGWLMVRIGAALPHLDAALTSYSLVASWWQARKHTANWWLWIAVDVVYIGEYALQGSVADSGALCGLVHTGRAGLARLAARSRSPTQIAA